MHLALFSAALIILAMALKASPSCPQLVAVYSTMDQNKDSLSDQGALMAHGVLA